MSDDVYKKVSEGLKPAFPIPGFAERCNHGLNKRELVSTVLLATLFKDISLPSTRAILTSSGTTIDDLISAWVELSIKGTDILLEKLEADGHE